MKKIRRIILGLVLLVVMVIVVGLFGIDLLAKMGVEKGATYALGVETTVGSLDLSVFGGSLEMEKLRIANPEGFSAPVFVESGKFSLRMDPSSVFSDTIEVNDFELDGLDLHIEQKVAGNNVGRILDNLKRFESDEKKKTESKGKKIKAEKILVKNVKAHFYLLPGVGPAGPITVEVPEIEITDLTSDDAAGLVIGQLVSRIVQEVLKKVLTESEGAVPGDVLNGLNGQLSGFKEALGEKLRGLADKLPLRLPFGKEESP